MHPRDDGLPRGYGGSTAAFVVIASMVGTGILVSPGYLMVTIGHYPIIIGLWILGGALAMCGALCVAELSTALPKAGGEYVYLREAYGPMPAFLSGWTSFFLGFSAPLAVASHVAAIYLLAPFVTTDGNPPSPSLARFAATILIVVMTVPNLFGHRPSAWTQNLTTVVKITLFAGFALFGFFWGKGSWSNLSTGHALDELDIASTATQLFFVMFAYSGWNAASYIAGEVRNPAASLPLALIGGTALVVLLYLLLSLLFAYAIPREALTLDNAEQVAALATSHLFGRGVTDVFSIALGLTFLSTLGAFIVTGPRIYYAMAGDHLFPRLAARLSRKGRVPAVAMAGQSVCAVVILLVTDFQNLYKFTSVGLSLFTFLFVAAVYVLRLRRPELPRPFRVPGYPITPAVYLAVTLFMGVFAFKEWPGPSLVSAGTILLGVPAYYAWVGFVRRAAARTTSGSSSP